MSVCNVSCIWARSVEPRSVAMGAAFSRARERPFRLLLPWPFRSRSRARRTRRPSAGKAEDTSDAIEMEPAPQLTSALKQQDAAAQAQEWCLQYLGGDGPDAGPERSAPKRPTADSRRRQREAEEAEAEAPPGEFDEAAALELEEQVHDEVARLRRLRTAELAGCMGAAADLAMLLAAAELVSARAAADGEGGEARTLLQAGALLLLVRGLERNDVRPSADRVHRLVHAVRALLLVPSLGADPTLNAQLARHGGRVAEALVSATRRHPTHNGVAQSACEALAGVAAALPAAVGGEPRRV